MSQEGGERLFGQIQSLWLDPEIERRRAAGQLPEGFKLERAQIILHPSDGKQVEVRLNHEVRAKAMVKVTRSVQAGETLSENDIQGIDSVEPLDSPNAAHVTVMWFRGTYWIFFDFRYNKARAASHVERAKEFLAAADDAIAKGHRAASIDSLLSGVELLAKAFLLTLAQESGKKHTYIKQHFNALGRLNFPESTALLNRLYELRRPARYLEGEVKVEVAELRFMSAEAFRLHQYLIDRLQAPLESGTSLRLPPPEAAP